MKIQPLADRVLVKIEEVEEKTASGIFIPQTAQEKTQTAEVVAVGDDKDVINVKPGQKIMYDKYAGTSVKVDGNEHLLLRMSDILAIIED
ncbi:MAG: co-chaperone GroES [Spirochaetia bacterium]|nr:co-chaperone GroES [Spirochaetia bacterium]MCF7946582.1 co-chaperone GroES [Spirochaetia bacterium]MCF7952926.1 co-chaperone GroES [Spirochaetales bacterium]